MTKIKSIHVQNFKAISEQNFDFNGASVIVTAGNNKGKTSALRGLIDRFQGEKVDIIVKQGEEKGENVMELTDGCTIAWKFTQKSETFSYTTADEIKMTTGVLSAIGEKYFGNKFNIDKFIGSSQTEQAKQVQALLGIDLEEIEKRYKLKFDERTEANRELKRLKALNKQKPEKVEEPNIEALKTKKEDIKKANQALKEKWEKENEAHQEGIRKFNSNQNTIEADYDQAKENLDSIEFISGSFLSEAVNLEKAKKLFEKIAKPQGQKPIVNLPEPQYESLDGIDAEIENAFTQQSKFDAYEKDLKEYNDWVAEGTKAKETAEKLNEEVSAINDEKLQKIREANLPEEFEFSEDGLLYNGLPVNNNQISSSAKYICALKLGYLALGKLRTLHFDCSFLDNNSLKEIQKWADSMDLQLLLERPDYEGGDIKYEIIES